MKNPWEEISLSDYEEHMSLDSVRQLQTLNEMMKGQLNDYPAETVMILGVEGGNGLEHVQPEKYKTIYGVDINSGYLQAVSARYRNLSAVLQCLHLNLAEEYAKLPHAQMVIADLLIEYIGYDVFQKVLCQVDPAYVSCIIQINAGEAQWVSDSPYLHAFDGLDAVHHPISDGELTEVMNKAGYRQMKDLSHELPNGKKLARIDFVKES